MYTSSSKLRELEAQLHKKQEQLGDLQTRLQGMASSTEIEQQRCVIDQLQESLESAETNITHLQALAERREGELQNAETKVARLQMERQTIVAELTEFEQDLNVQRRESQRFGVELQKLKAEQQGSTAKHAGELAMAEGEARLSQDKLHLMERELANLQQIKRELEFQSGARSALVYRLPRNTLLTSQRHTDRFGEAKSQFQASNARTGRTDSVPESQILARINFQKRPFSAEKVPLTPRWRYELEVS